MNKDLSRKQELERKANRTPEEEAELQRIIKEGVEDARPAEEPVK